MSTSHIPVLLNEVIDGLHLAPGATVVDCTTGGGGHAKTICEHLNGAVTLVCLDRDPDALVRARKTLGTCRATFHQANFRDIDQVLTELGIGSVDGFLFDLGLSSDQLNQSKRGFQFSEDEPLLMTFDPSERDITAATIVNEWSESSLVDILFGYGQERFARRIARAIVATRDEYAIETTRQLAEIITEAVPPFYRHRKIHPATKTFQALRIVVNDELGALRTGLQVAITYLKPTGRIAVISFHSLEDRIVKHFFRASHAYGRVITKKPITPTDSELQRNPRSRSAKLRIFETYA